MRLRHFRIPQSLAVAGLLLGLVLPVPGRAAEPDADVSRVLLELEVRTALLTKIGLEAGDIGVRAVGDRIYLVGTAPDRGISGTAEDVAASVEGVRRVKNQIKIEPQPKGTRLERASARVDQVVNDDVLQLKIKTRLVTDLGRSGFGIDVESHDMIVNLSGRVPDAARHQLALQVAGKVEGVKRVVDLLKEP